MKSMTCREECERKHCVGNLCEAAYWQCVASCDDVKEREKRVAEAQLLALVLGV